MDLGFGLVPDLRLLGIDPGQKGFEGRGILPLQEGLDRPVFLGDECRISSSRSQIRRTATVCTRPALNPRRTLSQRSGLTM